MVHNPQSSASFFLPVSPKPSVTAKVWPTVNYNGLLLNMAQSKYWIYMDLLNLPIPKQVDFYIDNYISKRLAEAIPPTHPTTHPPTHQPIHGLLFQHLKHHPSPPRPRPLPGCSSPIWAPATSPRPPRPGESLDRLDVRTCDFLSWKRWVCCMAHIWVNRWFIWLFYGSYMIYIWLMYG